ncbi:MAG: copper chaperone PCu(A)C [Burkholderiales bacterium]|nr:copper chaperone PCu(A)C [Burkholderiales bacterium]
MKRLLASVVLAASACAAWAGKALPVKVENAWARAMVAGQQSSAVYMRITAAEPLQLVDAATPAARITEVHEMRMEGDVMKMRAHPAVPLPAGQAVDFKPGGLHVMLMDLPKELKAGTQLQLTLTFRDARGQPHKLGLPVPVRSTPP